MGFVSAAPREEAWYAAFFDELRGLGFVEGQNLTVILGGFQRRGKEPKCKGYQAPPGTACLFHLW
jgi:hypothetical protein